MKNVTHFLWSVWLIRYPDLLLMSKSIIWAKVSLLKPCSTGRIKDGLHTLSLKPTQRHAELELACTLSSSIKNQENQDRSEDISLIRI